MRGLFSRALLAALVLAPAHVATGFPDAARIQIGPNILVSRDGDFAHCETMVSASPRDPKNLIGTATTMSLPDGGATNRVYASSDGGSTWKDTGFDEGPKGGGDPQVGFGSTGTAYFVGISLSGGLQFHRSEDGGRTWSKGVRLGGGDHDMLVTDHTLGSFGGRIYVAAEGETPGAKEMEDLDWQRRVILYRSADDGRSFLGPIEVARSAGKGLAAYNLLVLSDGTLFVPMSEYPNYYREKTANTWKSCFALSSDGGVTFSPRRPIVDVRFGGDEAMREAQHSGHVDQITGPVFAVSPDEKYRDRLYNVYTEAEGGRYRLFFTFSSDRGKSWSKPRPLDAGLPADVSQFQPMIDVNPQGVLGVFWYTTGAGGARDRFDAYFTASVDGGETFLPASRVSSETSHPFGAGNLRPGPMGGGERGLSTIYLISGVSRWTNGGDYIGMTADADGTFHPFWADSRSGTYQLYTAAVRVATGPAIKPAAVEKAVLGDRVSLEFDPLQYDVATRQVVLPVRLKNASTELLYPPFHVEIKELVDPASAKAGVEVDIARIVNASNQKTGVGAVFDYSRALHDLEFLEPGGVSDAIVWRLQAESPVKVNFYLGAEVTGFVLKKGAK